jgi:chromosome segregation ATPase
MLDALKNMTGGKGKIAQQQSEDLEMLLATAKEERSAISAMLTALTTRTAKLTPLSKQMEQVTDVAAGITRRLDDLTNRLSALDDRTTHLEEVDQRIQSLKDAVRQAELTTQKAIGPDGELAKHREAVQHLSSQALQTQTSLDALRKERAALDEMRAQVRQAEQEVKQSLTSAGTLKGELDQVRAIAAGLQQDYNKLRESSREAREDTNAALTTVKEVEQKLGPLTALHELTQNTEERLNALNALSEHVSRKAKALETQQQAVEHAVVQANRVNEMVWSMDVQIGKLTEGMKQAAKAEETIGRIEKLAQETSERVELAAKMSQETQRETSRLERETAALLDAVRSEVGALGLRRKEFEAFEERVGALQGSIGDAETRMESLAAKDKNLALLSQKVDGLAKRFEAMFAQADDLTQKQLSFETLHEKFAHVDELAKKTAWQISRPGVGKSRTSTNRTSRSSSCATSLAPIGRRWRRSATVWTR